MCLDNAAGFDESVVWFRVCRHLIYEATSLRDKKKGELLPQVFAYCTVLYIMIYYY